MNVANEIASLVARFMRLGASANALQETEVRSEYIDPLFQLLGWDMNNIAGAPHHLKDVLREESHIGDTANQRPDYTFRIDGTRKFFGEAKRPSVDINMHQAAAHQARSYGWTLGLPISVLTNFRSLRIYDARLEPSMGDNVDVGLIAQFDLTEYASRLPEIAQWISRESTERGSANQFLGVNTATTSPANQTFLARIDSWRQEIAQDLAQRSALSESDITDITQKIINRIIFIRMCEDRGIEGEHSLRQAARDRNIISLRAFFQRLDNRYNTGLFDTTADPLQHDVSLDPDVFLHIVDQVYSPYSPYSFSVLDADFLGQVYEHFLVNRITLSARRRVSLSPKPDYIDREVVTTPQPIVDELVRRSVHIRLQEIQEPLTLDHVLTLRVLDIAVGSGRFLIQAFERLCEAALNCNLVNGQYHTMPDRTRCLTFSVKREIATNCLFGIDIDFNACEIAKFSLLIKLLEDESNHSLPTGGNILPNLDGNILWGNSVVWENIEDPNINHLDWSAEGLPDTFDLIIGNPPYMKTEDMMAKSEAELNFYKKTFNTAYKQFDKYFVFIERAIKNINEHGVIGMVVPNKWMTIEAGKKLREMLSKNSLVEQIVDFGNIQVFEGRSIYICLLLARGRQQAQFNYRYLRDLADFTAAPHHLGNNLGSPFLEAFGDSAWVLPADDLEATVLRNLLSNTTKLGDIIDIKNGIQTSANRIYLLKNFTRTQRHNQALLRFEIDDVTWEIEEGITKPFVDGPENIGSYKKVTTDAQVIFPYFQNPNEYPRIMTPAEIENQFPLAWAYLEANRDALKNRNVSPEPQPGVYYAYGRQQALETVFANPKIIYSVNQRGDKYGFDTEGIAYASGGTAGEVGIIPRSDTPYSLEFILALLNQPPIEFFLRKRGSPFRGGYFARGSAVIANTPVPNLDLSIRQDNERHETITREFREVVSIETQLQTAAARDRVTLTRRKREALQRINAQFHEIWRFGPEIRNLRLPSE